MKFFTRQRILGFTTIELMIVLVIVAILLALAYPSYIQYIRKSNRGAAQQMLLNWSINQEIWRSNHALYATTSDITEPCKNDTDCDYDFTVSFVDEYGNSRPASYYRLTATARSGNDQENDVYKGQDCSSHWITSDGEKQPAACWE
jgi:type IV pilus assembly protein PilE